MVIVAATLITLGLGQRSQLALVTGLAVVEAGLGLFTPRNNTAIMAAAPKRQPGMAGGVLDMTRGTGPPSAWHSPGRTGCARPVPPRQVRGEAREDPGAGPSGEGEEHVLQLLPVIGGSP
jgi:hypothetical protein